MVNNFIIISMRLPCINTMKEVEKLTIGTPPEPMARLSYRIATGCGTYTVAIAWSKDGRESGLSTSVSLNVEGIELICRITNEDAGPGRRFYMTERNGSELLKVATVAINTATFTINSR